jgi:hypothetical protein
MADITFRLPGREQYSYAEVHVDYSEIEGPEGENFLGNLLAASLAAINLTYPKAEAPAQVSPAQAPPVAGGPSCQHGPRKHAKGTSARGAWQALFCSQPKDQGQCPAVWLKPGDSGWQY